MVRQLGGDAEALGVSERLCLRYPQKREIEQLHAEWCGEYRENSHD